MDWSSCNKKTCQVAKTWQVFSNSRRGPNYIQATHVRSQRLRHDHAAIGLLIVLQHRDRHARQCGASVPAFGRRGSRLSADTFCVHALSAEYPYAAQQHATGAFAWPSIILGGRRDLHGDLHSVHLRVKKRRQIIQRLRDPIYKLAA